MDNEVDGSMDITSAEDFLMRRASKELRENAIELQRVRIAQLEELLEAEQQVLLEMIEAASFI